MLRWSEPLSTGGCETTGYKLYRDDGAGGSIDTAITFSNTLTTAEPYTFEETITLGALFTSKTVRFKLGVVNERGETISTGYLSALFAALPSQPTAGPTRISSSASSLEVEMPLVTANGGIQLTNYTLWIDNGLFGNYTEVPKSSTLLRTVTISNLT